MTRYKYGFAGTNKAVASMRGEISLTILFKIMTAAVIALTTPSIASAQSATGVVATKFRASNGKNVKIVSNEFTGETDIETSGSFLNGRWTAKASCKSGMCETPYYAVVIYTDYSSTYNKATLRGGINVSADFGRSQVSSCRNGCSFYQIIIVPITDDIVAKISDEVLQVMLTGASEDKLIELDMKGYRAVVEAVGSMEAK
jgi:hypothetical protein